MATDERPTVLVTGGAGYIGSHTAWALFDAGYRTVVVDDLSTGFRWAPPPVAPFALGDVGNQSLLARLIDQYAVGAVMHFAGSIIVPESVSDPLKYYRNNTANSRTLIAAAVEGGVKHIVFSSTAAVYGNPDVELVGEESPLRPINPYGRSKLMTEVMLSDVAAAHDMNYCALRYFNVAGADPAGRTGQSTAGATHLIKVAVEAACGKRESVGVFGSDFATPDGTGVRDYIHVSDLAAAHVIALERLMADPKTNHTLNCGYGRGFSVLDVLDCVDKVTGVPLKRQMLPRRAGDPAALIADNRRILETLDWRPQHACLEEIVRDALRWERQLDERREQRRN